MSNAATESCDDCPEQLFCTFDIYRGKDGLQESHRRVAENGHEGTVYELLSPDGISFAHYNIRSARQGSVVIDNRQPFIQLSYTVSGRKSYATDKGLLAAFSAYEYNYLFLPPQELQLSWEAGEPLEIFELGISTELFLSYLPEEHPFFLVFSNSVEKNIPSVLSHTNLPLSRFFCDILYHILRCPLEGRYKQLFLKSKVIELLAYQLEQYEQVAGTRKPAVTQSVLKKEDIERMHQVRMIIMDNLDSPCSLVDLAHQVGTNEAYLKKHFKLVFGNTVFGYLQNIKMNQAREMLLEGKQVAQVAGLMGYKYPVHFARAFKKHFGFPPTSLKNKS